ncbi:hypothetical protein QFZ75_004174 [Streptomyces sp. V3I8]|uniref:hypothetical protein n=1 Tax=Streptomyces sp. V3I8 TaxID=3042279 RepID=UPI0027877616|nr:hypothetical protein [Streptomyces sp. V3I8]MDQ1037758.1 hypothetical protein [Streptomyces sp. V3I8]
MNQNLDNALKTVESIRGGSAGLSPTSALWLTHDVAHLDGASNLRHVDAFTVQRLTHLAEALAELGMRQQSLDVVVLALRNMELSETEKEWESSASLWNRLGTLLAEHDQLPHARTVLTCALRRADRYGSLETPHILSNLSIVSLRAGDLPSAAIWAKKVLRMIGTDWQDNLEARLTAHSVLIDVAAARDDIPGLQQAVEGFQESLKSLVERVGDTDVQVIAARTTLADARYMIAAALNDTEGRNRELTALELNHLHATAALGMNHRETIVTQAALAAAEFHAAGEAGEAGEAHEVEDGGDRTHGPRRGQALHVAEAAMTLAQQAPALGREHAQTHALRRSLAGMRAVAKPEADLPYEIEKLYTPLQNGERNEAKKAAIKREQSNNTIRLIAHAGASYFLYNQSFYSDIVKSLDRGVQFHAIISNPWNNLAVSIQRDAADDPPSSQNIVESVKQSTYYAETFQRVTDAYQVLRNEYADLVELRLTTVDIPGSTLLTSDIGFLEPYITSNIEDRTGRGLGVFEVRFGVNSRYYADSLSEFMRLWDRSSTWQQFKDNEERHKSTLRSAVDALADIHLGQGIREGGRPRP